MTALIRFALGRPITAAMIFLAVIIFGTISALVIPLDYLPRIPVPKLAVSASYPGLPPREVGELLAVPLEESFSSLKGLTSITTVCRKGAAVLELTFSWGTDMAIAAVETREKIDSGFHRLPSDSEKPVVLPVTPGEPPVLTIAVIPEDGDLITVRRLCEREITSRLQQVEGTGAVTVTGGLTEEVHLTVDEQKAAKAGLSVDDIARTLSRANTAVPAGAVIEGDTEYTVITEGRFSRIKEITSLRINPPTAGPGGIPDAISGGLPLRAIADIRFAPGKQHSFFWVSFFDGTPSSPSRCNPAPGGPSAGPSRSGPTQGGTTEGPGLKEAIVLQVRRRGNASPVTLARSIERELDRISGSYGDTLSFTVIANSAELISSSVTSLLFQTVLGIAASFGILLIFLRKIRYAVILLVMIPTSILFSVLLLFITGKSLNIMSLGGIALSTGMIIDNGIVVLENMVRRRGALEGAAEVAPSIFGSTLTTLIVFVPVVFIPGLMGSLYTDLALAVVFALSGSYFCSVMFLPVLFSKIRGDFSQPHHRSRSRRSITGLYAAVLGRVFRRPVFLFLAAGAVVMLGILSLSRTEFELFQKVNSDSLDITVRLPAGTPTAEMKRTGREILTILRAQGLLKNGWCIAGGDPDDPYFTSDPESRRENLRFRITLPHPIAKRTVEYITHISSLIQVEGGNVSVTAHTGLLSSLFEKGGGGQEEKVKELTVVPRENILLRTGISREELANTVRSALEGVTATTFEREGEEIPVRILFGEKRNKDTTAVMGLPIPASGGTPVTVGSVAEITTENSPSRIYRVDRKEAAAADAQTDPPRPPSTASPASAPVPIAAFLLALLLMYLALGAQFESFITPLVLFMSIPLSLTGVFIGLAVSGNSFDLSSSLGVLVLMGIGINNAIILFETYRRERYGGGRPLQAVFRGSLARVRPILMTALTTAAALLPVAVDPYNRSAQSGMAASVIGGLIFSTVLTLVFLPPCYLALTRGTRGQG
jgi:multidrug efflux pump subunit AcrB